jgi:hypothetical protein
VSQGFTSSTRVLWLALAFLIAGCSSAPQPVGDLGRGSLILPVKLLDSDRKEIPIPDPIQGSARLGSIPGMIFGDPRAPFGRVTMNTDHSLSVDLSRLQEVGKHATRITAEGVEFGWKIHPVETRFSRVSTTFDFVGSALDVNKVGFFDLEGNDVLLLVFFDRPCRLTGTINIPPGEADFTHYLYDVTIDKAGFNWLAIHKDQKPGWAIVRHAAASVRPVYMLKE